MVPAAGLMRACGFRSKPSFFKEGDPTMALFVALGGLVGGAVVLAALRTKRNAKKTDHVTTMKIR